MAEEAPDGEAVVDASAQVANPESSKAPEKILRIDVSNPALQKQSLFNLKGSYVSYLITTEDVVDGVATSITTVRRRFREIVALADILKDRYSGYMIPARPEKNVTDSQSVDSVFTEERRAALHKYLNTLGRHPVIAASKEFRLFLQHGGDLADSSEWKEMQPTANSLVAGTSQLLGIEHKKRKKDDEEDTQENWLVKQHAQFNYLEEMLAVADKTVRKLDKKIGKLAKVFGEVSLQLFTLSKFEDCDGANPSLSVGTVKEQLRVVENCISMAGGSMQFSTATRKVRQQAQQELKQLDQLESVIPMVRDALRAREHLLSKFHDLSDQLVERETEAEAKIPELASEVFTTMDKCTVEINYLTKDVLVDGKKYTGDVDKWLNEAFEQDPDFRVSYVFRKLKIDELNSSVERLKKEVAAAHAEYDTIKKSNVSEVTQAIDETCAHLVSVMKRVAGVLRRMAHEEMKIWLQIAKEMGADASTLDEIRTQGAIRGLETQSAGASSAAGGVAGEGKGGE